MHISSIVATIHALLFCTAMFTVLAGNSGKCSQTVLNNFWRHIHK